MKTCIRNLYCALAWAVQLPIPTVVQAQVNYAVSGSTAFVTNSPNASGSIVIASMYDGLPVTSIGYGAFSGCTSLTSATIPNSVTSISDRAFFNCINITNVTIPSGVVSIGDWTFTYCPSLTNVVIPNTVTSIGLSAFESCASITSVTIPIGLSYLGGYAFFGTGLRNVDIPNTGAEIGMAVFGGCTSLTNVTLAHGILQIGDSMFGGCTNLPRIIIPPSVTRIGNDALSDCTNLKNVTIPNSVTDIGQFAFYSCANLTNLTFLGNAPSGGTGMFDLIATGARVYYYYGTTGWGTTYGGLHTVMLGAPAPQVGTGSAGVKPGGFGFTLNGVVYQTIVVEASTDLANWQPIWTSTLSTLSVDFVDPDWMNHNHYFYRLRSP